MLDGVLKQYLQRSLTMLTNEAIYALLTVTFFVTAYVKLFTYKKTTDYDDYKLVQSYFHAKRKGIIK